MDDYQKVCREHKNIALNGYNYFPRPGYWRRKMVWLKFKRVVIVSGVFVGFLGLAGCQDKALESAVTKIITDSTIDLVFMTHYGHPQMTKWLCNVAVDVLEKLFLH